MYAKTQLFAALKQNSILTLRIHGLVFHQVLLLRKRIDCLINQHDGVGGT